MLYIHSLYEWFRPICRGSDLRDSGSDDSGCLWTSMYQIIILPLLQNLVFTWTNTVLELDYLTSGCVYCKVAVR